MPDEHAVQLAAPTAEYRPIAQSRQSAESALPVVLTKLPAGHGPQLVEPCEALNCPAGQSVHRALPLPEEYLPLGQNRHEESAVAPGTVEYFPPGQPRQVGAPLTELKKPGLHRLQLVEPDIACARPCEQVTQPAAPVAGP